MVSVVSKTALGQQVMKDRSVSLTAQQRSALILIDGKRTVAEVLKMTAGVGVTSEDLDILIQLGLIDAAVVAKSPMSDMPSTVSEIKPASKEGSASTSVDFPAALNAAITLCSNLGFKGFSLNMALTGVDSLEKLQKLAPEIRQTAGSVKYAPLHKLIFGEDA
jgi:hypothetical protein